jgi:putative membrane protein
MKTLLRNIAIYTLILFVLPLLIPGFSISGGVNTLLVGSFVLTLLFIILKPILSIISFPVNILTLGVFNIFINGLLIYLLTVFVTEITITSFTYENATVFGFITPVITFNTFFAYLYTAFVLTLINSTIRWLIEK